MELLDLLFIILFFRFSCHVGGRGKKIVNSVFVGFRTSSKIR